VAVRGAIPSPTITRGAIDVDQARSTSDAGRYV
jgi:hypothetical protein